MRRFVLLFVGGCSFHPGVLGGDNANPDGGTVLSSDSSSATDMSMVDARECWMQSEVGVSVCLGAPPTGSITISSNTSIDTSSSGNGMLQCRDIGGLCVIAAQSITINSGRTLSAHGDRPLVLIASTTIQIDGTIDVASHINGQRGAGANMPGCTSGTDPTNAGGGQGGSFGGKGGDGGNQDGESSSKGLAGEAIAATTLRGGCPGRRGGNNGGPGGDGGGAVMLFATTIAFGSNGVINASGAAGRGGGSGREGGGGAGSGGMIAFSATQITAPGEVFANGGGGGGGSDNTNNGSSGGDSSAFDSGGNGGNGGGNAGDGGDGYPSSSRNGASGGGSSDAGGGGGGGAGVIRNFSTSSLGGKISPPAS